MDMKVLLASFALVFLAELGDKTQLTALAFTTSSRSPWMVFFGTSLALITTTALAVLLGELLTRWLPPQILQIASAVMFVLVGLILLVNVARKAPVEMVPGETEEAAAVEEAQAGGLISNLIMQQAAAFEEEMIAFLGELADRASDGTQREALNHVIEEDREHAAALKQMRDWREADADTGVDSIRETEVRAKVPSAAGLEPGLLQWDSSQTEERADPVRTAMEREEDAAEFYLALSRITHIPAARRVFRRLAVQELRHVQTLADVLTD